MNGRTIFLIVLGMSASFSLVLGIMITLIKPDPPPRVSASVTSPRRQATPVADAGTTARAKAAPPPATTTHPAATLAEKQPQAEPIPPSPASHEIDLIKKTLGDQIQQLKKDRDAKLLALARELAQISPAEAAAQLSQLDDEAAALTLARMPADKRPPILGALDKQRAARLTKRLKNIR